MALHQPLVPVLPVARELLSKTKLTASKSSSQLDLRPPRRLKQTTKVDAYPAAPSIRPRRSSSSCNNPSPSIGTSPADESTALDESPTVPDITRTSSRARLLSVFNRGRGVDSTRDVGGSTSDLTVVDFLIQSDSGHQDLEGT